MASYQYVYTMHRLTKAYPGGREVLKDINLSFLPGAKIGVLGLNGSGKSTLLRIMAGEETEFNGEARLADGATVALKIRGDGGHQLAVISGTVQLTFKGAYISPAKQHIEVSHPDIKELFAYQFDADTVRVRLVPSGILVPFAPRANQARLRGSETRIMGRRIPF